MLRVLAVSTAFIVLTLTLIPVQWAAVALELPLRRSLPVVYHRMLCALLAVRVKVIGERCRDSPLLVTANHVSWLDISVLTALAPVVFVAKREVADWPLFGLLAKLQRSVFVERERRSRTAEANREIAERLAGGDPVVLFAEGTSSDGNRVLPFRSSLIGAVHATMRERGAARVFVQPLAIAYVGVDGLPAGRQHRPWLAWYGAMDLLPHLAGIMRRSGIDVTVAWGPAVPCDATTDRKVLAGSLEAAVRRLRAEALRDI
jgi:1-acyl-sn-glycerol-3-phosphate acyltransferase